MAVMKYVLWMVLAASVGLPSTSGHSVEEPRPQKAVAVLRDPEGKIMGTITLTKENHRHTLITGEIYNLTPGEHGFHIHTLGDLSDGCSSAGGHFNPTNEKHGDPLHIVRHVGDLGNINADASGKVQVNISDPYVELFPGPYSIVGRSVMVHDGPDDLGLGGNAGSLASGNAGPRVACGVIGLA